jgi:hypothetical protein
MVAVAQPSGLRNAAPYVTRPRELRHLTAFTPYNSVNWAYDIHVFRYARQHDAESLRRGVPSLFDCSIL